MNLLVISLFSSRGFEDLNICLASLSKYSSGVDYDICISVNMADIYYSNYIEDLIDNLKVFNYLPIKHVIFRENTGYNIGSWDHAWRTFQNYTFYLFIQEEVIAKQDNWFSAFIESSRRLSNIFLLGECDNPKCIHVPWGFAAKHYKFYYKKLIEWEINPESTPACLRSLIIFTNITTLKLMGGFKIGKNKEECIAAEIGMSKQVKQLGGTFNMISDTAFKYLYHREWKETGYSKNP